MGLLLFPYGFAWVHSGATRDVLFIRVREGLFWRAQWSSCSFGFAWVHSGAIGVELFIWVCAGSLQHALGSFGVLMGSLGRN